MSKTHKRTDHKTPIRVLHVAFTMHARGTETWLMNLLRRINRQDIAMDFVTIEDEVGVYDAEIKALGGALYACPHPNNKGAFLRAFRKLLEEQGPYDVVHAHPYTMSGPIMLQAARAGVPVRITHSHTDRRKVRRDKSWVRRFYKYITGVMIKRLSTYGIAASKGAAKSLFGKNWANDKRWNVMYCGIDLKPFAMMRDKSEMKQELGIPAHSKVMGHVGSFHFEKNHDFIIRLFAHMAKKDLKLILVLVGDGPLMENIQEQVIALGLESRVILTGVRPDIADILNVMDAFIFPSLFEGMGLSLIEAQAAGIPCVASDAVPREAAVNDNLVSFLPVENADGLIFEEWEKCIKNIFEMPEVDKQKALKIVQQSEFNIDHNAAMITALYQGLCGRDPQGRA